jgi:hypothetical protein
MASGSTELSPDTGVMRHETGTGAQSPVDASQGSAASAVDAGASPSGPPPDASKPAMRPDQGDAAMSSPAASDASVVMTGSTASGRGCATGGECATGYCVDTYCCESSACGTCEHCAPDQAGRCAPTHDTDDSDTCTGERTCSSQGACLRIDQQTSKLFDSWFGLGRALGSRLRAAQSWTVGASGQLVEVRLALACGDNSLLEAGIEEVDGSGVPTGLRLAELTTSNVSEGGVVTFSGLSVQPPLMVQAGKKLAVVVGDIAGTEASCTIGHTVETLSGGGLFTMTATDAGPTDWMSQPRALNFQALMLR